MHFFFVVCKFQRPNLKSKHFPRENLVEYQWKNAYKKLLLPPPPPANVFTEIFLCVESS